MIVCLSCNLSNPDGASACAACGAALPAIAEEQHGCPQCGASIALTANFCGQCGFKLQPLPAPVSLDSEFPKFPEPDLDALGLGDDLDAWNDLPNPGTAVQASVSPELPRPEPSHDRPHQPDLLPVQQPAAGTSQGANFGQTPGLAFASTGLSDDFGDDLGGGIGADFGDDLGGVLGGDLGDDLSDDLGGNLADDRRGRLVEDAWDAVDRAEPGIHQRQASEPESLAQGLGSEARCGFPGEPVDNRLDSLDEPESEDEITLGLAVQPDEVDFEFVGETPADQGAMTGPTTRIQTYLARLIHIQTNTIVELPHNLTIVRIGKANDRLPPDIDVSVFPHAEVVSRVHANLRLDDGNYFLEDTGSANGTFINDRLLLKGDRHLMRPGDRISLGKHNLVSFLFQLS